MSDSQNTTQNAPDLTTEQAPAQAPVVTEQEAAPKQFEWMPIAIVALLVSSIALWLALFLGLPNKAGSGAFGAVDIEHTLNLAMMVQTSKLTQAKTDEDREQIRRGVEGLGKRLEDSIDRIQSDCRCVLVIKQAVVAGMKDHTPTLRKMMGVDDIDEAKLSNAIAAQLANKIGVAPTTLPPSGTQPIDISTKPVTPVR